MGIEEATKQGPSKTVKEGVTKEDLNEVAVVIEGVTKEDPIEIV